MTVYDCDCCGRSCSRTHHVWATGGTETFACDLCADYDWEAYGEEEDPVLLGEE